MDSHSRIAVMLVAAVIGVAEIGWADCPGTIRSATAQEKRIYADGFAAFKRIAPPAPAGWETQDSPKDGVLTEVCDIGFTKWSFSRQFTRIEGGEDRRRASERGVEAVAQRGEALRKANEAKLADVQRQMEALTKKMIELAAAGKLAEIEAAHQQMAKLVEQQNKLMGLEEQDAATEAINAAATRDIRAGFSITIGETALRTDGYVPFAAPTGKGYRQDYDNRGNPEVNLMVVLNPSAPPRSGYTVVHINGDTARAEALLKAATLR